MTSGFAAGGAPETTNLTEDASNGTQKGGPRKHRRAVVDAAKKEEKDEGAQKRYRSAEVKAGFKVEKGEGPIKRRGTI